MSKVLFIGPLHEQSGWGTASRDYVLALDSVGVEVVCRPVLFQNNYTKLPERIKELEKRSAVACDVCIQHVLPHMFEYNGNFKKNIGLFVTETLDIKGTSWPAHIDLMDECWVPNLGMVQNISKIVKTPLKVMHHTFDISKYKNFDKKQKISLPGLQDDFVFYFIGEYSRRKNITAMLKAFHTEFHPSEPVSLLLKLNRPGCSPEELGRLVDADCTHMKEALGLYKDLSRYKSEILMTFNIDDNEIMKLHNSCDSFVLSSFGEAWCIPAFESQAIGKPVVANEVQGICEYIYPKRPNGYRVSNRIESLIKSDKMFPDFGSARESWFAVSVEDLKNKMRLAYEERGKEYSPNIENFSYEAVGKQMLEAIED